MAVGGLEGKFTVTPTGAAHYSIPLAMPPGTNGIAPKLNIVYDSNNKNGLLGMGFALEGLTAITRVPQTLAQNGEIHGVDFTGGDHFALNGEQLIAVKGAYGQDQTEYRTQVDDGSKIVSYGQQGAGPASFEVWTKDGQIAEYGATPDSNMKADVKNPDGSVVDAQTASFWALDKIQDRFGNYFSVQYTKDDTNAGSFYPSEIDYTGNANAKLAPYNQIKFIYASRPDVSVKYHAGSQTTLNKLLSEIQVFTTDAKGQQELVYDYHLTYEVSPNTSRSRLTSIQMCDGSGNCYPATTFQWQTNDEGWEEAPQYAPPSAFVTSGGKDNGSRFIDLTGNGLLDIIQHGWDESTTHIGAWINTGVGWQDVSSAYTPPPTIADESGGQVGVDGGVRFIDLTGNGLTDMVQHSYWGNGNTHSGAWINTGTGWQDVSNAYTPPPTIADVFNGIYGLDGGVRLVDLTGNGLIGMVQHSYWGDGNTHSGAWINTGTGWQDVSSVYTPSPTISDTFSQMGLDGGVRLIDLTGDGLVDMVQHSFWGDGNTHSGAWINIGSGWGWRNVSSAYTPPPTISDTFSQMGLDGGVRFIDLNDDGLVDMVQHSFWGDGNTHSGAWINTGRGWASVSSTYTPPPTISDTFAQMGMDGGVRLIDLNGSGLVGMFQNSDWGGGNIHSGAWINTGSNWGDISSVYTPPVAITKNGQDNGVRLVDLTGSGFQDIVFNNGKDKPDAWLNKAKKLPDYLIGITEATGEKTDIDYEPLSGVYASVYSQEKNPDGTLNSQYPNPQWDGPLYVVYQTASDAAINDPRTLNQLQNKSNVVNSPRSPYSTIPSKDGGQFHLTTYHYTGARINKLGLGFLGFHQVQVTDNATGIYQVTTYSQNPDDMTMMHPVSQQTFSSNNVLLSQTGLHWVSSKKNTGTGIEAYYQIYVDQMTKTTYELNDPKHNVVSTETTQTTENYDNNDVTEIKITDADSTGTYVTDTQNTYSDNPDQWLMGEVTQAQVTKSAPNVPDITRTSNFQYDAATGALTQTVSQSNDPNLSLTTDYQRDVFGNVIQTTVSGKGIDPQVTQLQYDPQGQFVIKKTDPMQEYIQQVMDPRFGEPLTVTDENGLTTSYQYDGFGRKIGVTQPDGVTTAITYQWTNPSLSNQSLMQNKNAEVKTPAALTPYHETFSQAEAKNNFTPTYVVGMGMNDQPITAAYNVTTQTAGAVPQTIYYDELNREVASTTENFDGTVIWKDTFYDQLGRVIQQSIPYLAGSSPLYTRFTYDVLGRVTQTVNPDNTTVSIDYDGLTTTTTNSENQKVTKLVNSLGEVMQVTDNLGGVVHNTDDAYGDPLSITDSMGNVTTFIYDALGHKTSIHDPDKGNWTYQYDVLGNLISQTDAKGQTTTFAYDALDRLISHTDVGGTSTWTYGTDRDQHNVGQLIAVDGIANAGHTLKQGKIISPEQDGLASYSKDYAYDQYGFLSTETDNTDAGSYTTKTTYDSFGRPLTVTYPNGTSIINIYNNLGYLTDVKDVTTGQTYWHLNAMDAQGHVTSFTRSNGLVTTETYDDSTGFLTDIQTEKTSALAMQDDVLRAQSSLHKMKSMVSNDLVQSLHYQYDSLGNIQEKKNAITGEDDTYQYDGLNRVTAWSGAGQTQSYQYDLGGNITERSDRGTYHYGENGAGPQAVTSITDASGNVAAKFTYDANGDQISADYGNNDNRQITYTSYSKPLA